MVKKLIKHEMLFYLRTLLPVELILLGMALLVRFVQFFESDTVIYDIVSVSSIVTYVIAIIVCFVMMFITGITRFYKNLYTAEGYLSFTLPVTHSGHIFSKLFSAVAVSLITVLVIGVSLAIATAGEVFSEIVKAGDYLFKMLFDYAGAHSILFIIEVLVLTIVSLSTGYLLYYTCITAGQMAKKNRVLAAFGIYFGYYFVCQTIGTFFMTMTAVFYEPLERLMNNIAIFAEAHPIATVHIVLISTIILDALIGGVYYFLTHLIMKKRLNLE